MADITKEIKNHHIARADGNTSLLWIDPTPVTKTADYNVTNEDDTFLADATGGSFSFYLPPAADVPSIAYRFKKIDSSANSIVIVPDGAETIEGDATKTISTQYDYIWIESTGTTWIVCGEINTLAQVLAVSGNGGGGTITNTIWNGSVIGLAYGGTNKNLTAVNGGIVWTDADSMEVSLAGTSGQILRSGGAAAPTWSTATYPATAAGTGTILRADGTNWVATTATYPNTFTATYIPYATGLNVLGESASLSFSGTTLTVGVGGISAISNAVNISAGSTGVASLGLLQNSVTRGIIGLSNGVSSLINGSAVTDLCIRNSQRMLFSADSGVTANAAILATGEFLVGATALVGAEFSLFRKDQNASTNIIAYNGTSGTAAQTQIAVSTSTLGCSMGITSAGYTTSGVYAANCAYIYSATTAGLILNTGGVGSYISFVTGGTSAGSERVRINSNGLGIGMTPVNILDITVNQNAGTIAKILNTNASGGSYTALQLTNATYSGYIYHLGTGFTTSGARLANSTWLDGLAPNGIGLSASNATGFIIFATGASYTERMRLLNGGQLVIGASTLISSEKLSIQTDQNASTSVYVRNTTNNTAAKAVFGAITNGSVSILMQAIPGSYTSSGIEEAARGVLSTSVAGGMNIGSSVNAQVSIWTNNTKKVEISAVGNVSIGGVATRATTVGTNSLQIFDGTAPVGTLANGCSFYSTAGEMRVMDAAGNATLLSPHEKGTNYWIYDSVDTTTGKRLKIDMEKFMKWLNKKFKTNFVHEYINQNN